jgi:ATP-dependent DNA ligase
VGESLISEKMKKCVWLRPEAVAQIEFLEWTQADRLGHSKFVGLREDKDPHKVVKDPRQDPGRRNPAARFPPIAQTDSYSGLRGD